MTNTSFLDSTGVQRYRAATGNGTEASPFVLEFSDSSLQAVVEALSDKIPTKGPKAASGSLSIVSSTDADFATPKPTYGSLDLAVTDTLGNGATFDVSRFRRFRIQIHNTGSQQLTGFELATRAQSASDMQVHASVAADYTAPGASSIIRLCGDLGGTPIDCSAMFGGSKAILAINLTTFFAEGLRIRAKVSSGQTSSLNIKWGGIY